jgi:hypothetical protein
VKLKTTVKWIQRDEELEQWKISVSSERDEEISNFDKIVICTDLNINPAHLILRERKSSKARLFMLRRSEGSYMWEWLKHTDV